MLASSAPEFKHRHNREGRWDSICMKCFLTVATSAKEEDLVVAEKAHDCSELWKIKTSEPMSGST